MKSKYQHTRISSYNSSSQLGQLQGIIDKSIKENRTIFKKIYEKDNSFAFQLYNPVNREGVSPEFLRPLLLKQIDQLMMQKDTLLKKKEQADFLLEVGEREVLIPETRNTYTALREAWTKFNNKDISGSQHIDNLNKIVGMVKKNINLIIETEKQTNLKSLKQRPIIIGQQVNSFSLQNTQFKQKIQELQMKIEDLSSTIYNLEEKLESRNRKISRLQEQLTHAGQQIKKSLQMFGSNMSRIRSLEELKKELQRKIQQMQSQKKNEELNYTKVYQSYNGQFKIKIDSLKILGSSPTKTNRTICEIILFLNPEKFQAPLCANSQIDLDLPNDKNETENILPTLDLSTARTFSNFKTDRYTPKPNRFISTKTPRATLHNSFSMQSEDHNDEERKSSGSSKKKFIRKGEFGPMTTDRYKNSKCFQQTNFQIDLVGEIKRKL